MLFFLLLWVVGKTAALLSDKYKQVLLLGLVWGVAAQAAVALGQKLLAGTYPWFFINGRPVGLVGEPNALSGYLAIGSVLLFSKVAAKEIKAKLRLFILFLVFAAILLTQSRTGLLTFWIMVVGWLLTVSRKIVTKSKLFLVVLISVAVYFSLIAFYAAAIDRGGSRFESRALFWDMGLEAVSTRPLLGYGAESGEFVYDQAFSDRAIPLKDLIVERSHNLFLDVAIWSGLVGLAAFIFWIALEARRLFASRKFINLIGVVGLLAFSMLQPLGVVHWLLLTLLLNLDV